VGLVVVRHVEWLVDFLAVVCDLDFCFLEGVGDEVVWLHRTDWESQVVLGDFVRVQWVERWLVCASVL
jgi:hypothetical protein